MGRWPGYAAERMRLARFLADRHVPNAVVFTGDIHSNWVNDPVVCCLILSIYGLFSFVEKQLKIKFSKMKIELKFSTADRLKLRVGKSQDWITMLPGDRHEGSGYDY